MGLGRMGGERRGFFVGCRGKFVVWSRFMGFRASIHDYTCEFLFFLKDYTCEFYKFKIVKYWLNHKLLP